ncbi:MAG: HD-GYP domain-containing protein, partial [Anaerolineaceae bacterium]|nr:HD-GYP domain-containing protein [Anaerolineaceae bacterium]
IVEGQVIGVFSVQSDQLTREDVPVATAFAHELAGAWNKTKLVQELKKTVEGTIHTIAATVEIRDPYTAGHQKRVAELAAAIASEMNLSEHQVEGIRMAGFIHDLGKIQVPAEILSKPGQLSELEFSLIKSHPQVGYDLLKDIEFPWPIADIILQHHEKMNGSGYPQGLKGDEIKLEARILAVADIIEAMSSHRPYRPALGIEKALEQIRKDRGALLNPDVVDACLRIFKEGYKFIEW